MILPQIWNINSHVTALTGMCSGSWLLQPGVYNLSLPVPLRPLCHHILFVLPVLPYANVYQVFQSPALPRRGLLCVHLK